MISHAQKRGDSARDLAESEEHIRKHSLFLVSANVGRISNITYREVQNSVWYLVNETTC